MNKIRILIVNQENELLHLLEKTLHQENCEFFTSKQLKQHYRNFNEHSFDIVLIDIDTQDTTIVRDIESIREQSPQVKIAIFSDFNDKHKILKSFEYGANQFFSKPLQEEHFTRGITTLCQDVINQRQTQNALTRQQNILHTIKEMAEHFLQHDDWNITLHQQMLALKNAAEASSVFIFKNIETEDEHLAERFLSINDNYEAFTPNTLNYNDLDMLSWTKELSKGRYINGVLESFSPSQRSVLISYKINALLILPIFAAGEWWGFLGLGNPNKTIFDHSSIETLETVARIIGSAINNQTNLRNHKIRSAMFEHTVDGIVITDAKNRIINVNQAFSKITGFSKEEVLGKDPKLLKSFMYEKKFYQEMWQQLKTEGYWQGEIKNRRKNDELFIEWLSINSIKNERGVVQNYVGIFSDVTAHRSTDVEYAHLATHDALTGLANRVLLDDRLNQAIHHAKRFNKCVAVLFCDLDNFKPINDKYGHTVGDEALKLCSHYFCSVVRAEDTVARYGGDEFVIILGAIEQMQDYKIITDKICNLINVPFEIQGHKIQLEMSVGISFYPQDALIQKELIHKADKAMYNAKKEGKNRLSFFNQSLQESGC